MLCYLMFRSGHSAVVRWLEGKDHRAAIIPAQHIAGLNMGMSVDLPPEVVTSGAIPYGLDFEMFVQKEGVIIEPIDLQNAMRAHGVWTLKDLRSKPQEAIAAFLSVVRVAYEKMLSRAGEVYGG